MDYIPCFLLSIHLDIWRGQHFLGDPADKFVISNRQDKKENKNRAMQIVVQLCRRLSLQRLWGTSQSAEDETPLLNHCNDSSQQLCVRKFMPLVSFRSAKRHLLRSGFGCLGHDSGVCVVHSVFDVSV